MAAPGLSPQPAVRCGPRVLYVEDNTTNALLVQRALTAHSPATLSIAPNAEDALTWLSKETPDLILLDLHLPGMSGEELLKVIRSQPGGRALPVVVITADAAESTRTRLLSAGATLHMTKPLDIRQLLDVVARFTAGVPR